MTAAKLEIRDGAAIIWVDNPPVNALSQAVRQGIIDCLQQANATRNGIEAIVLACRGRTFMAGADITEFGKPPLAPTLPEVLNVLEASPRPVVAAIHGTAFGGGLETALACHWRIADPAARVGQPEVKLGLIPGAGGTQRLPRLAGVQVALDLVVGGNPIGAVDAQKAGIVDRVAEGDLVDAAVAFAHEIAAGDQPLRKVRDMEVKGDASPETFAAYREKVARRTRGLLAPECAIQAVEAAASLTFDEGLRKERELFRKCMESPQSGALRHVFFAERAAAKIPGIPRGTEARPIERVGVIGAGTMGGGIAMNFLNVGVPVTILEVSDEALDTGLGRIQKNYEISAKRGKVTEDQVKDRMGLITRTTDYAALGEADLIIEAVFENLELKKEVFRHLDAAAKPSAILATNTSYLNINEIAAETGRPADVLGLHFFSPANVMRLLEIVRADKTAPDALVSAMKMAKRIGKIGVVAGVCHGFIGNRMLEGYGRESGLLVLEGSTPERVDKAMYDFGFPMGPFTMFDMAGVDIGYLMRQQFPAGRFDTNAYRLADRLVEMGRKGQKTGAGFYRYEEGSRTPIPDPEVLEIAREEAKLAGIEQREISDEEIVNRCVLPLVNEGAKILEEGIALRPGDIDIVYVTGYGFPAYRGGPMYWADHLGLERVLNRINRTAETQGQRWWAPAPLLERLVRDGLTFSSLEG